MDAVVVDSMRGHNHSLPADAHGFANYFGDGGGGDVARRMTQCCSLKY